jgi:hypothetical protein
LRRATFHDEVTKLIATEGNPIRAEAFERAGRESARFRRAGQGPTAGLRIVLLAEAVLRVWTVWFHPLSSAIASSVLSQVLGIGLLLYGWLS